METQFVIALAIALPVILFPAALVWYLTAGGIFEIIKEAAGKKAAAKKQMT